MQNQSVPFFSENRTFTDEAPFFPEKGLWKHIPDARLSFMHEHNFLEIGFMEKGAGQIATQFNLNENASDIITGIILFFILGSEFFINYRLVWRGHHDGKEGK